MTTQVFNPLGFYCPPNGATPDYIIYHDFKSWLSYGLLSCWLSVDPDDPNANCNFPAPWTREDVHELRGYFLDLVETVIARLWKGRAEAGDGYLDNISQSVCVGERDEDGTLLGHSDEVLLTWYVRLDNDSMMFELSCTGADPECIWLAYEAVADRQKVLAVLREARATIDDKSWTVLEELAGEVQA
jgi:hypothetical protein